MMDKAERAAWVARGFQDPVKAYRAHAVRAGIRGIEFKMTFAEWWDYWKHHYEQRGVHKGQMVMCRTLDRGGYEVGNVRIDTTTANAQEQKTVRQIEARSEASDWLHKKYLYGMGYFRARIYLETKAEKAAEAAELGISDEDDDEC